MIEEEAQEERDDPAQQSFGSSDDFGDDDFDTEMANALDVHSQQGEPAPIPDQHRTDPTAQGASHAPIEDKPTPIGSDDDFGIDDDEDDFAADLEHVASLYDTRSLQSPEAQEAEVAPEPLNVVAPPAPATVVDLVDDDEDDEFGDDDIDVDVFAAAEVAATQAPTSTVGRSSNTR